MLVDIQNQTTDALNASVKSSQANEIKEIEDRYLTRIVEIRNKLAADANKLLDGSGPSARLRKQMKELNDQANAEEIKADQIRLNQLQSQYDFELQQKLISQQEYNEKSLARSKQLADDEAKLRAEELKKEQEREDRVRSATATGVRIAQLYADAYVAAQQKKIDSNFAELQSFIDKERESRLAQASSEEEKEAINIEFDKRGTDLQKKKFEEDKQLKKKQLALEFVIAEARAIADALSKGLGLPGALFYAGLVAAEYAAQLSILNAQTFEEGGQVPASGGEFGGNPHSQGGTPFIFQGQAFEAEAKEVAIINKKSSQSTDRYTFSGTPKQIASAINQIGGGVNFAPGAKMIKKFAYGGTLGTNLSAPVYIPSNTVISNGSIEQATGNEAMAAMLSSYITATNERIDRLVVVNDPNASQKASDRYRKAVELATL